MFFNYFHLFSKNYLKNNYIDLKITKYKTQYLFYI